MTQAMLAVYPDIFKAGSARAGVPAGCWRVDYDYGNQWSNTCKNGSVNKTAQEWGDWARIMYDSYEGSRPRAQLFHGEADTTIVYQNMGEAIEQWTKVLGLDATPTSTDSISPPNSLYNYNREFWEDDCGYTVLEAWSSPGNGHSMNYEEDAILAFFGLDEFDCIDPQVRACSKK